MENQVRTFETAMWEQSLEEEVEETVSLLTRAEIAEIGSHIAALHLFSRFVDFEAAHKLYLPLPPGVNNLYPTVRGIRRKSRQYREWLQLADLYAHAQDFPLALEPQRRRTWELDTYVFMPKWTRDLDGTYKATIDYVGPRLGLDDRYLIQHYAERIAVPGQQGGVLCVVREGSVVLN